MRGRIRFFKGVRRMPAAIRVWLLVLIAINMAAPLFFLEHLEARVTIVTMMLSAALMSALMGRFGFTRIRGAGHVLWIPLRAWLALRLDEIPSTDAFGVWVRARIALNATSLAIDVADVIRYASGDRDELVPGL